MITTTRIVEDEMYETTNENGNLLSIDMRGSGQKEAFSPMELLLGALSGCVAVDIVEILKKRKKEIKDFKVETSGERSDQHPRGFTKIHSKYIVTSTNVKDEELHKIAGLALYKYCSVAASLNAEIDYSVEVVKD